MYLQDVEVLKEIPGYKALLKAVIKSQIQMLVRVINRRTDKVEQLSDQTGEESIILTASTVDGSLSHLGSLSGKDFFDGRDEIKSQFLSHILKKLSQNGSSDAGSTSKKARYEEPDGRVHTDLSYAEQGLSQQYDTSFPMQSQASNALGDWETPQSSLGHFETSTDRGGKMVVRKKRFKHVASKKVVPIVPSVPNIHIQREERSDVTVSVGVKPEGLDTDDNVNDRTVNETDAVNYIPRVTDSEQSLSQPSVKVEQDDGDDDDDMAITGVEPGNSQSGYQSSEMDGSFDQSYQQGDSFISPNASAGDLSYAKAAFVNPAVPLAVMNTREQEAFMMSVNTMYGHHGNQNIESHMINANISAQDKPVHLGEGAVLPKTKTKDTDGGSAAVVEKGLTGLEFRRYPCSICGKLFSQKSDVRRHQVVHTGQKFACSYCNKQFSQKHGRNLHEKAHRIEAAGILNNQNTAANNKT